MRKLSMAFGFLMGIGLAITTGQHNTPVFMCFLMFTMVGWAAAIAGDK